MLVSPIPSVNRILFPKSKNNLYWKNCVFTSRSGVSVRLIIDAYREVLKKDKINISIPSYFCAETEAEFSDSNVNILRYPLLDDFEPDWKYIKENNQFKENDIFVFVHFFGEYHDINRARTFCDNNNCILIEDCAHVLYKYGKMAQKGDFVLFSPHKLLGLMDGAVILCNNSEKNERIYKVVQQKSYVSKKTFETVKWRLKKIVQKIIRRSRKTNYCYQEHYLETRDRTSNIAISTISYNIIKSIDEEELKKPSVHVDMPVHADAADLLSVLDQCLDQVLEAEKDTLPDSLSEPGKKQVFTYGEGLKGMTWNETCAMWKKKYPVVQKKHWEQGEDKAANVYAAVQAISSRLKEGQITVVGNGSACVVGGHAQIIKKGQRFISNSAVASMGYDLPAAIGIWAASRKDGAYSMGAAREGEDVILITGDGSIQMNLQELQTIIHHKMGIKIFIINNGGYHSIRQTQKNFFGEPLVGVGYDSGDLSFPDMEKLSAAYGYPYVRAEHNGQLAEAVEKTLAMEGPVICEIIVSTDQNFEPKSSAKRLPDGTLVSPPLEDMAPFLPDEEMDENMIIPRIKG